jgi:predicted nuclease of predicted toxin-antitoxin system
MAHAAAHDFVVLTHDLDFGAILAATQARKPSVVQLRAQIVSPEAIGDIVVRAVRQMEAELRHGAILTIDADHARLRLLPLPGKR